MIQGQCCSIKVQSCCNIEYLPGKNRTGEQLVDSAKTKTKTATGTLRGKFSKHMELSAAFNICLVC